MGMTADDGEEWSAASIDELLAVTARGIRVCQGDHTLIVDVRRPGGGADPSIHVTAGTTGASADVYGDDAHTLSAVVTGDATSAGVRVYHVHGDQEDAISVLEELAYWLADRLGA